MTASFGPLQDRWPTKCPGDKDRIHPYAWKQTRDPVPLGGITALVKKYIPQWLATGKITFVWTTGVLEVWSGKPTEIAVDESTGRGVRGQSTAQMFFEFTQMNEDEMSTLRKAFEKLNSERRGEATVVWAK